MSGKNAGLIFLVICILLAILLVNKKITAALSGALFALVLVILGLSSKGFRKNI